MRLVANDPNTAHERFGNRPVYGQPSPHLARCPLLQQTCPCPPASATSEFECMFLIGVLNTSPTCDNFACASRLLGHTQTVSAFDGCLTSKTASQEIVQFAVLSEFN